EPDASRTAAKLREAGHEVTVDPLLAIESVPLEAPRGDYAALAVTSINAVRTAGGDAAIAPLKSLPLYVLGMPAANAARRAGFSQIEVAGGDARALAQLLARRLPVGGRVLYLAGEKRARDLGALVALDGIDVETRIVYRAVAAERLMPATAEKLAAGKLDVVL